MGHRNFQVRTFFILDRYVKTRPFLTTTISVLFFSLYENEIKYLDHLLTEDIRNNSAWNQRFFVVSKTLPNGQFKGEVFEAEVDYVLDAIKRAPDNESSWNYLQG